LLAETHAREARQPQAAVVAVLPKSGRMRTLAWPEKVVTVYPMQLVAPLQSMPVAVVADQMSHSDSAAQAAAVLARITTPSAALREQTIVVAAVVADAVLQAATAGQAS
jgi:hypothetical protein